MALFKKIKDYIQPSFGNFGSNVEIEAMYKEDMYLTHIRMGIVIMLFEAMMIVSSLLQGGPGTNVRRQIYFCLYFSLFFLTAIFLFLLVYLHAKKSEKVQYQINLSFLYAICLCTWSCSITLLDQHSGPNITVYSYILMATAVFCMIKPWQSILLFGGSFLLLNFSAILLNGNPIYFSAPLRSYNLVINSFFTTTLTLIIAITLYRYRIIKKHNSIVIQQQYDQIALINKKLNDLAMTDQLTGVGNRRFLEEKLLEFSRPSMDGYSEMIGMMLDIDYFKQYNDHYGHQAGDVCLRQLASVLQTFAKEEHAIVVRYGGEEFFLCMQGSQDAYLKADSLRKAIIAQNLVRDDMPCGYVTVSIGVHTEKDWRILGQDKFLHCCDQALYAAKNAGRNTVCLYTDSLVP